MFTAGCRDATVRVYIPTSVYTSLTVVCSVFVIVMKLVENSIFVLIAKLSSVRASHVPRKYPAS